MKQMGKRTLIELFTVDSNGMTFRQNPTANDSLANSNATP